MTDREDTREAGLAFSNVLRERLESERRIRLEQLGFYEDERQTEDPSEEEEEG
jgi:hypothetical protein